MLRHLDLFSGIGGFALAARMVGGYETIGFCEIDRYCQAVLRKHWPGVPIYDDVRTLSGVECDVITGGFPCQPFSEAGKGLGREDDRHLWPEYRRLIEAIRPAWVLAENVAGIINLELDNVLADLESLGYAATPFNVPACAVGAWHRRERIWIVAHAASDRSQEREQDLSLHDERGIPGRPQMPADVVGCGSTSAYADSRRQQECAQLDSQALCDSTDRDSRGQHADRFCNAVADALGARQPHVQGRAESAECPGSGTVDRAGWWDVEPDVGRVAHGVSRRVDRLRGLGNAIVPQVAAIFLQAIKECAMSQISMSAAASSKTSDPISGEETPAK